jgi:hypothetical protein
VRSVREAELLALAGLALLGFVAVGLSLGDPVVGVLVGTTVLLWPLAHIGAARPSGHSALRWWAKVAGFVLGLVVVTQLAGVVVGR